MDLKKDGLGNIVISEYSFEMLLACLDNQKFLYLRPVNGDSLSENEESYITVQRDIQKYIDECNNQCREILHQKYILTVENDGYFLSKRYEHQTEKTKWSNDDVALVYELFKDTKIIYKTNENLLLLDGSEEIMKGTQPIGKTEDGWIVCEPEDRPWLIERPLSYDYEYLTISEDGFRNRPWKQDEIDKITKILNERR